MTAESHTQVLFYLKNTFTTENLPGIIMYDNMCNFSRFAANVSKKLSASGVSDPFLEKLNDKTTVKKGEYT